ncbi:hypothetical protein [Blastococcus sp. SYSU D00695]
MPPHEDAEKTAARFKRALDLFLAGMEAVDELAVFAHEHARPLDDEDRVLEQAMSPRVTASAEQHRAAIMVIEKMMEDLSSATDKSAPTGGDGASDDSTRKSDVDAHDDEDAVVASYEPILEAAVHEIAEITGDPRALFDYLRAYGQNRVRVARLSVLNSSLLTTAVSNFEVLVSSLIKQFLVERPQAVRSDDARYSLAEISAFETLDEFRDFTADRYVESILRGSFDDWMNWFDKQLKVKLDQVASDPAALREVFQRRHLFVHNGGRVNRLYLSKLTELRDPPAIDDELVVDGAYLSSAVDSLTATGALLTALVLRKLVPVIDHDHPADSLISNSAYQFLRLGRWRVVVALTSAMVDECASDYTRYVMQVNGWLARKRQNGIEAIRQEVEAWQVSALAPRLQLARLALLDDNLEAYKLARILVERNEISQSEWDEWPLLQEVRQYAAEQDTPEGGVTQALEAGTVDGLPDRSLDSGEQ